MGAGSTARLIGHVMSNVLPVPETQSFITSGDPEDSGLLSCRQRPQHPRSRCTCTKAKRRRRQSYGAASLGRAFSLLCLPFIMNQLYLASGFVLGQNKRVFRAFALSGSVCPMQRLHLNDQMESRVNLDQVHVQQDPVKVIYAVGTARSGDDEEATAQSSPEQTQSAIERTKIARARASQLVGRSVRTQPSKPGKQARTTTSVGEKRTGSAAQVRRGVRATSKLMDALRKTAIGVAAAGENGQNSSSQATETSSAPSLSRKVTSSVIQLAIEDLLRNPMVSTRVPDSVVSASFSSFEATYVGEAVESRLRPGSVLLEPEDPTDRTAVCIAGSSDDVNIASLRLSVFSEFSPDMQNKFHARSCQAMHNRRLRGALCLVAKSGARENPALPLLQFSDHGPVLGSAECSFHEFFGTRLGRRRPQHSLLYITEVAVNPAVRRRGIGLKLLQAADKLAALRGVETLYLHVDVANAAALALYEKAGYKKVVMDDAVFLEFTTSLNLHPGATQGRDHYLLYKDLISTPTWLNRDLQHYHHPPVNTVLGIEIPA